MNLSIAETELFYRLHSSWLVFVNRALHILPENVPPEQIYGQNQELFTKLRDAADARPDLLEEYVTLNPDQLPPNELLIVASWRYRIKSTFYIMRNLKAYTVMMNIGEPTHLYGVLGLWKPIEVVLGETSLPVLVETILLPFNGRIIYDGLMTLYAISFGGGIRSSLNETYNRLKKREGIIEALTGPDGQPQIRTSLTRKVVKPVPDWRPVVNEIVNQTQKMRDTETDLQAAAFSLLRAVAKLAQATLQDQDAKEETIKRMRSVRRAITDLEQALEE